MSNGPKGVSTTAGKDVQDVTTMTGDIHIDNKDNIFLLYTKKSHSRVYDYFQYGRRGRGYTAVLVVTERVTALFFVG